MFLFAIAGFARSMVAVLAAVTPLSSAPEDVGSLSVDELVERLRPVNNSGHFDAEQDRYVLDPVPAELRQRLERGARLTDLQWQRAIELSQAIHVRPKWPADLPVAVFMEVPVWLGVAEIRAKPLDSTLPLLHAGGVYPSVGCGNWMIYQAQAEQYQELGPLALGPHRLSFDVEVEIGESLDAEWTPVLNLQGPPSPSIPRGILWRGRLDLAFEVVPSIDQVLPPRADASLDQAIRNSLCLSFIRRNAPQTGWDPRIDVTFEGEWAFRLLDTAVSLDVEVWSNETMVSKRSEFVQPIFGTRPSRHPGDAYFTTCLCLLGVAIPEPTNQARLAGYSLRIRGSSHDALRHWDATSRWDGEIRIPLADVKICDAR